MDKIAVRESLIKLVLRSFSIIPFVGVPELYDVIKSLRKVETDLDKQVQDAAASLQKSSGLVTNLERVLKERAARLQALQIEYKRLSTLTTVTREQIEALSGQIDITLGKNRRIDVIIAVVIHLIAGTIFFVVGVFLSEPVKALFSAH